MKTKKLIVAALLLLGFKVFSQDPPTIEFVGNANIQKSLTSGEDLPANTGIGVIYREDLHESFGPLHSIEVNLNVNIASTVDTLKTKYDDNNTITNKADFGNSILLPSNSGQAFGFRFIGYLTKRTDPGDASTNWFRTKSPLPVFKVISGFNINFNGSNRNWYDSESEKAIKVANLSLYVGLFHEFIKRDTTIRKDYSITLGCGFTGRWITGDIAGDDNSAFRTTILGTDKTSYTGFEINLGMRLKNIRAEVRLPILSNKDKVVGLTGIQPNTFIGFVGGFSLKLS